MTGSRATPPSPSTVSTMRNTPWVAGCCGPTLTLTSIVSSSFSWGTRYSVAIQIPLPQPEGWGILAFQTRCHTLQGVVLIRQLSGHVLLPAGLLGGQRFG